MEIELHPDLERFVREMADGAEFRDEAEVVAEALYLLWQEVGPRSEQASRRAGERAGMHEAQAPERAA